jgi:hypothetical protein
MFIAVSETKTVHARTVLRYHRPFSASRDGTNYIVHQHNFVRLDQEDYSKAVFLLMKWFVHAQIQRACNTALLFVLDATFAAHRRAHLACTFETFTGSGPGYCILFEDYEARLISCKHSSTKGWNTQSQTSGSSPHGRGRF